MHYHLELVMPPTTELDAALKQILAPFDENRHDEEDHSTKHAFFDYYLIGGRWAGSKLLHQLGQERVDRFYEALTEQKITVSSFQAGKQTLAPAGQETVVDALWNEQFPDSPIKVCPIFDNYRGNYGEVMQLKYAPLAMKCSHVIIAGPDYKDQSVEAKYMVRDSEWNGVSWIDTVWDRTIESAIDAHKKHLENAKPEYAAKHIPQNDWIVVTVDYHS